MRTTDIAKATHVWPKNKSEHPHKNITHSLGSFVMMSLCREITILDQTINVLVCERGLCVARCNNHQ